MKKAKDRSETIMIRSVRAVVFGGVAGAILCTVFLIFCAFILSAASQMPQTILPTLTLAISAISAFLAGIVAARISGENGLLCGALSGFLLFLLIALSGFAVAQEPLSASLLTKGAVMVICGAIGGVLAVNRRVKVK